MEIKQQKDIMYTLTVDEDAYGTIKSALRYSAEVNPGKLRGWANELLSIFPSKHSDEDEEE